MSGTGRRARWRWMLAAGVMALAVGGCGVPLQDQAEPLPRGALPTAAPTPTHSQRVREATVYFVSGRALEGVPEPIAARTAEGVMAALAAGPPVGQQSGLRTLLLDPLTGAPMLILSTDTPELVTLERTEAYLLAPPLDQVLAIGQVVLSLADIGRAQVQVTDEQGTPVPLPLPDGRLAELPVTAEDYEVLVAPDDRAPGPD